MIHDMEGFEHRQATPARPGWVISGGSFQPGRFGGFCIKGSTAGNNVVYTYVSPVTGTAMVGVAIYMPTGIPTTSHLVSLRDGAVDHLSIRAQAGNTIGLFLGTTLIATSTVQYISDAWNFFEIKGLIANAGGSGVVRVNMVEAINFTGDTQNGAAAQVTSVFFNEINGVSSSPSFDDIYVGDTTGSAPGNDLLGDTKVETLVANADGTYSQLVGSDGNSVSNFQQVDELPSSATDYNGSAVIGNKDTYNMTNLVTASGQAFAVRPLLFAHKSDAGAASLKVVSRLAGVDRVEAAQVMSATANVVHQGDLRVTDPSNAAWTIANVNATEFGMEVA